MTKRFELPMHFGSGFKRKEMVRAFYYGWYHRFVTVLPPVAKGRITVPAGPGLGLALQPGIGQRPDAAVRRTTPSDL